VPARARQAALLARAGKPDEARALLAATRGENDAQDVRLIQAQAELLRDEQGTCSGFRVAVGGPQALSRFGGFAVRPRHGGGKTRQARRAGSRPAPRDRAAPRRCTGLQRARLHLADRTDRLAEAIALLDKALSLAPEDPFILDSVGWAQYRSGNLARAQEYLERAYKVRPDPEIAAHLGEVLWARGQRDEAGKLWQTSLQAHPQNELLLETLRRLKP
jgi:tetratricopeptide (TPR) repeat protein